jgi:hypothetical protein
MPYTDSGPIRNQGNKQSYSLFPAQTKLFDKSSFYAVKKNHSGGANNWTLIKP